MGYFLEVARLHSLLSEVLCVLSKHTVHIYRRYMKRTSEQQRFKRNVNSSYCAGIVEHGDLQSPLEVLIRNGLKAFIQPFSTVIHRYDHRLGISKEKHAEYGFTLLKLYHNSNYLLSSFKNFEEFCTVR